MISILRECEGLPLAIAALGGLMATKAKSQIDEWEIFHRSPGSELESNDKFHRLNKILFLISFNNLPHYLQRLFPVHGHLPRRLFGEHQRLIWLWMAEGFVVEKEEKTLEEIAQKLSQ